MARTDNILLEVNNLKKYFPVRRGFRAARRVTSRPSTT